VPHSAAGAQVLKLFERLGIAEEMKARIKAEAGPAQMVRLVAGGEAELGLFLTNVLTAPGLDLVGSVPAGLSQEIVYTAAVAAEAREPDAARLFVVFLKSPDARELMRAKGMTPG
jgi:molybdate transport system substrate-binding protein